MIPEITLEVWKEGKQIETKVLKNKSFYIIGCLPSSDLILEHPSISRVHAALVCDKNLGVVLIDLRSKAGTKLDGDLIKDNIPYRMKNGKKLRFGLSTREYVVSIDLKKMRKLFEQEKKQLESELELMKKLENPNLKSEEIKETFGIEDNDTNENIFVGNLPYDASEKRLKEILEDFGTIRNIRIPVDNKTGQKKGFAFIQYKDPESAKLAVKTGIIAFTLDKDKDTLDLSERGSKPRSLKVRYANPRPNWGKESEKNIKADKEFQQKMIKDVENRIKKKREEK